MLFWLHRMITLTLHPKTCKHALRYSPSWFVLASCEFLEIFSRAAGGFGVDVLWNCFSPRSESTPSEKVLEAVICICDGIWVSPSSSSILRRVNTKCTGATDGNLDRQIGGWIVVQVNAIRHTSADGRWPGGAGGEEGGKKINDWRLLLSVDWWRGRQS